jgi:ferredoxin
VAANILGAAAAYTPVPYFWTEPVRRQDQGTRHAAPGAEVTFRHQGRVTGVVGWNMPKQTLVRRREVVDALASVARVDHTPRVDVTPEGSTAMPIDLDLDRCEGHGMCEQVAPHVFELNDDGFPQILAEGVDDLSVRAAVRSCPVAALRIRD